MLLGKIIPQTVLISTIPSIRLVSQSIGLAVSGYHQLLYSGQLQGVIQAELIRPGIISLFIDGVFLAGATFAKVKEQLGTKAAKIQVPGSFLVFSSSDPAYAAGLAPESVLSSEYEYFNVLDKKGDCGVSAPSPVIRNTILSETQ